MLRIPDTLIDLLDGSLPNENSGQPLNAVGNDPVVKEQWEYLQAAVSTIRYVALTEQVAAAKAQYQAEKASAPVQSAPAMVRSLSSFAWRAAACIVLAICCIPVLKYSFTSPKDVYQQLYSEYDLGTTRGAGNTVQVDKQFKQKNWQAVVAAVDTQTVKDNRSIFLAGVAALELKNYAAAVTNFSTIVNNSTANTDQSFHDEAQYYLALTYLASNETGLANGILQQIRADNAHLYHNKVAGMSFIQRQVLDHKGNQ